MSESGSTGNTTSRHPHSGELPPPMIERPIQNFDNTTLRQAVEDGLVNPDALDSGLGIGDLTDEERAVIERMRQLSASEAQPQAEKKSRKGLYAIVGGVAGIAVVVGAGLGINNSRDEEPNLNPEPVAEEPADPIETMVPDGTSGEGYGDITNLPAEAQGFVANHMNNFEDPLATYYSTEDFISQYNFHPIIDPLSIEGYEFPTNPSGEVSGLGFESIKLADNFEASSDTFISAFDEFAEKCLTPYMNLVAKNPNSDVISVIDNELGLYCGSPTELSSTSKLMDSLKGIVSEHGSAATYEVLPITTDEQNSNGSYYYDGFEPEIDAVDEEGNILSFSHPVDIVVNVHARDSEANSYHASSVLEGTEIIFKRIYDPNTSYPNYVAIGEQGS